MYLRLKMKLVVCFSERMYCSKFNLLSNLTSRYVVESMCFIRYCTDDIELLTIVVKRYFK